MEIVISISPKAEARLKERAAASGQDASRYVAELVEHALSDTTDYMTDQGARPDAERLANWDAFVAGMREWGRTLPAGHSVDDSRDSIYAGRGE
jgi:hypothetical protein